MPDWHLARPASPLSVVKFGDERLSALVAASAPAPSLAPGVRLPPLPIDRWWPSGASALASPSPQWCVLLAPLRKILFCLFSVA